MGKAKGEGTKREQNLKRHWEEAVDQGNEWAKELDTTYAHLRALVTGSVTDPKAFRHAIVGLLPETRAMEPSVKQKMRGTGLGHLVELHDERVKQAWAEYGFPGRQRE